MIKLKQIKEFNTDTVTQEIAAEIASVTCWNHLNDSTYVGKFKITNATPYLKSIDGHGVCNYYVNYDKTLYIEKSVGVIILTPNHMQIRIWEDGNVESYYLSTPNDEYEHIVRHKKTKDERIELRTPVQHSYNTKLMNLYFKYKFYILEQDKNVLL